MTGAFLELRCKSTIGPGSFECRRELGGPSIETLRLHPFDKGPWEDTRYCASCHTMWLVTIPRMDGTPVLTPLSGRVNFVDPTDIFQQVIIKSPEKQDGAHA